MKSQKYKHCSCVLAFLLPPMDLTLGEKKELRNVSFGYTGCSRYGLATETIDG